MTKRLRVAIAVLIVLNAVVLLGQVWPEGAPPFARAVNVVCLLLDIAFLVVLLRRETSRPPRSR